MPAGTRLSQVSLQISLTIAPTMAYVAAEKGLITKYFDQSIANAFESADAKWEPCKRPFLYTHFDRNSTSTYVCQTSNSHTVRRSPESSPSTLPQVLHEPSI